jgi:gliding motility-associated protein GldE
LDPDPSSQFFELLLNAEAIIPGLALLLLLVISGLVSGSEVAFFSLSPNDIDELENSKKNNDESVLKLLDAPKQLLGTILISNNFINISIVLLSAIILAPLIEFYQDHNFTASPFGLDMSISGSTFIFLVQLLGVTFLILLFGEILPKIYANQNRLRLVRFMVTPLTFLKKVFGPVNKLMIKSTGWLEKPGKKENLTVNDLEHALDLTEEENDNSEEQRILRGNVKIGSTTARQIMTPRMDVVSFDVNDNFEHVLKVIVESGFSRIPVYEENFDNVKGTIYIKDLLPHTNADPNFNWMKLLRDPFFVPENKKIDDLLKEFQEKKIHLAIVVDEFGGTSGIISLEDVIEEIVGEISDEFDDEDLVYSKLDNQTYVFEGKTPLSDFCRVIEVDEELFEEAKGDTESLAGLMLEIAGKFPVKGEEISYENFTFIAESVVNKRVNRIKVKINA